MSLSNKNNRLFGGELAGSCLAVIASVPLTAWLGRLFGTTYDMRVAIYGGLLLWVVVGAVSIFLITRGSAVRLTLGKIGLWFVSTWLWPIPLAMHCLKNNRVGGAVTGRLLSHHRPYGSVGQPFDCFYGGFQCFTSIQMVGTRVPTTSNLSISENRW